MIGDGAQERRYLIPVEAARLGTARGRYDGRIEAAEVNGEIHVGAEIAEHLRDPALEREARDVLGPIDLRLQLRDGARFFRGNRADADLNRRADFDDAAHRAGGTRG